MFTCIFIRGMAILVLGLLVASPVFAADAYPGSMCVKVTEPTGPGVLRITGAATAQNAAASGGDMRVICPLTPRDQTNTGAVKVDVVDENSLTNVCCAARANIPGAVAASFACAVGKGSQIQTLTLARLLAPATFTESLECLIPREQGDRKSSEVVKYRY